MSVQHENERAAPAKKPTKKAAPVAGRQKMTGEEIERLGLDPAPYGKLDAKPKK